MEIGDAGDATKKKISFGLSAADEKIKLIDFLSEDDDFLVASPFCDHSLQASISEIERMEQKQQESRPSFLRRSLAWDSAFFNSSGVLDADELSCINNGFRSTEASLLPCNHDVRNRRSESEQTRNDVGFSDDHWFEIEPSVFESKPIKAMNVVTSPNSRPSNVQYSKKVDGSTRNKMKYDGNSIGKGSDIHGEEKLKKESSAKRSGSKNLSGQYNLNMDSKSIRASFGQGLVMPVKSASSFSSAKYSSMFSPSSSTASSLSKRKTELRKTQKSASLHTSKISRHSDRKKGMGNISGPSLGNQQFCSSPANSSCRFPSALLSSPVHKQRRSTDSKDVKEASKQQSSLQSPLSCTKQYGSLSSEKSNRPSALRPPSPRLRYFDESTSPPMIYGTARSRKLPQKVIPATAAIIPSSQFSKVLPGSRITPARKKLTNPFSESAKNITRPETALINSLAKQDAASIDAEATHLQNGKKKRVSSSGNLIENLCRNFKAFDLKQETKVLNSSMTSSKHCTRTPLAEKPSNRSSSGAFALPTEAKKEKLLQRSSSVRYG